MALGIKMQLINKQELEKEYSSYLDSLSKKYNLNVKINSTINEQMKQTEQITKNTTQAQNTQNKSLQELIQLRKTLQIDAQQFTQLASKYRQEEEFVNLTKKEQVQLVSMLTKAEKEHSAVLNSRTNTLKTMNNQEEQLAKLMAKGREASQLKSKTNDRSAELLQTKAINQSLEKTKQLEIDIALYKQKMLGGNGFSGELDIFAGKQKGRYDTDALAKIKTDIQGLNTATPELNSKIKQTGIEFSSLKQQAGQSGSVMANALENAGKFLRFYLVGGLLVGAVNVLKGSLTTIREMDTALTNLKKVSDELGKSVGITQFLTDVNNLAIEVGHSTKAAIEAITDFKKLGYSLLDSQELAKNALIYSNVGDLPIEDSTKSLISTMQGFKIEAKDTMEIIDKFNNIGNKFAVTSEGIGNALQKSAASLQISGNTLDESIALIASANRSVQDPEKIGNSLKTVSMRLRGISEETGEAIPKLDRFVKSLTGVDIMKDKNTFKSTYEILLQIGQEFDNLTDKSKANLVEKLFGLRQGNVGTAILTNTKDLINVLEESSNSAGSALQEQEAFMTSLDAKTNRFSETVVKFWNNLISTDLVKWFVDLGTGIINVADNGFVRFIASIILTTVAIAGLTVGLGVMKAGFLKTAMGIAVLKMAEDGLIVTTQKLTATLLASPLFWLAAGVTTIYAVVKAVDFFTVSIEEQQTKVADLTSKYNALLDKIKELKQVKSLTEDQKQYIDILDRELLIQEKILAIEKERLILKEIFGKGVLGKGIAGDIAKEAIQATDLAETIKEIQDRISETPKGTDTSAWTKVLQGLREDALALEDTLTQQKKIIKDDIDSYKIIGEVAPQALKDQLVAIDDTLVGLQQLNNSLNDIPTNATEAGDALESAFDFTSAEESIKTLQKVKEETKDLTDAMAEYNDAGKFNNKTLLELVAKYPDLIKYLGNEKELYEQISKKVNQKTTDVQTAYNTELTALETSINQKAKGYVTDLKNWHSIEEAKLAISKDMLNQVNDLYNKTLTATGDTGTAEISAMKFARRLKENLNAVLPDIGKYIDLSNFNIGKLLKPDSKSSKSSSTSAEKEISDTILKAERYSELNTQIEITNSLLEKNKAIQENLSGDALISSLREEQELYEQKQKNLSAINDERRKERAELTSYLKTQGAVFKGEGDLLQVKNAQVILQNKLDEVNAHRSDKDKTLYNQLKSQYDNLNDSLKRFIDLQTKDIPNASAEWWKLEGAIKDNTSTIEDNIKAQLKTQIETQQKIDELVLKDKHDREQTAFDTQKKIDDEAFSVKQQGEKDNFEAIKKIRDDAFSDQLQQQQDAFDTQKAIEDKAFEDSQQSQKTNLSAQTYGVTESDYNIYKANKITQLNQGIAGLQGVTGADSEIQAKQTEIDNLNAQSFSDLTDYQQLYTDIHQVRIDALDAELTALQATNEAQAETETRLKNQNDLIEKQTALKNALDNKNVQQLKKQSDGSWQYEYVADDDAVKSAQKAFDDQITSNQDWESQTTLKHKEDLLNQKKQYEQDLINAKNNLSDTLQLNLDKSLAAEKIIYDNAYALRQKALDISLKVQQDAYDLAERNIQRGIDNALKAEQLAYDTAEAIKQTTLTNAQNVENLNLTTHYADMNTLVDIGLKELEKTYGNDWDKINETIKSKLDIAKELYAELALIQAETGSLESADINNGGNSPTNVKTPQQLYAEARANGDWQGMEDANKSANNGKITASVDIEYIKKKYGHVTGGEVSGTGFQWLDGSLQKPERVLSAEQTLSFNKLVANLPNLMNLIKLPSLLDFSSFKLGNNSKTEQIFNIDKLEFPNVTNHTEIVQALDTISLRAKQYSTTKTYGLNQ